MNRRTHLKKLLAGGALLATAPWALVGCNADKSTGAISAIPEVRTDKKIGIQLFLVRDLLQRDVRGTLTALATIGFSELEMFGFGGSSVFINDPFFGLKLAEFQTLLKDLGLTVPTVHYSGTVEQVPQSAEIALALGAHHLIQPMAPDYIRRDLPVPLVSTIEDAGHIGKIADDLNRMGEACKRSGIGFAYHNHHMEFVTLGDTRAYDILMARTDPGLVSMELDVGWTQAAGVSAADYLERYPTRFIGCHLKDFNPALTVGDPSAAAPIPQMVQMVPPGDGIINFARLSTAMRTAGVEHGYVEVDLPQGDPLEVARRGYGFLAKQGANAATA